MNVKNTWIAGLITFSHFSKIPSFAIFKNMSLTIAQAFIPTGLLKFLRDQANDFFLALNS